MTIFGDPGALAAVLIMASALSGLVAVLNHNHRRTSGLPHSPFGADLEDPDLPRIRCELANARAHAA